MILTDVHDGEVRAVVGSRAFVEHGFNRAVEAQRPVGSLLKPFVYLLALAQPGKWSLASWVDDSPITISLGHGRHWTPGNSEGHSHGTVRLIDALAQSYNLATVRVGMQVGPERLADLIHTLAGIEATPNPSLILGAVDQSPYAMAQLYQFLASDGEIQPLHAVRGVLDPDGNAVNRYDKAPAPAQEGDAIAARLVTTALQQAVVGGTGRQLIADGLGRLQPAGKTGTTQRQPRQLVCRLDGRPPRGDLGRQRPEPADRPVRRHRRDAGLVGHLLAPAERATAGRRQGPGLAVGGRRPTAPTPRARVRAASHSSPALRRLTSPVSTLRRKPRRTTSQQPLRTRPTRRLARLAGHREPSDPAKQAPPPPPPPPAPTSNEVDVVRRRMGCGRIAGRLRCSSGVRCRHAGSADCRYARSDGRGDPRCGGAR